MDLSQHLSNFVGAFKSASLATFLFLGLPLGVLVVSILITRWQRRRKRSIVLPIIAAVVAEVAALVPFIGVAFFSKDNVLYLAIMPLCFAFTIAVLLPLFIPILCVLFGRTIKKNNNRISIWFYIISIIAEIVSLAITASIIMKDVYVP